MSYKILLCDDEIHIVNASKFKFQRAGYEVITASDGQEAWEAIEADTPDLVITDFQMPRLDGLGLVKQMRAHDHTRSIPVIMLTAKGLELSTSEMCSTYGISRIMHKPFSPRDLLRRAEELLILDTPAVHDTTPIEEIMAATGEFQLAKAAKASGE